MNDDTEYSWKSWLPRKSMDHPILALSLVLVGTIGFGALFPWMQINTDPEDMLPHDHPARVKDRQIQDRFFLHDYVAMAIEPATNQKEITKKDLTRLKKLVDRVQKQEGVVSEDILSLYTSDDIEGFPGGIEVDQFLRSPPESQEVIDHLVERVGDHPVLKGMVLNESSGGIALFVPVTDKQYSYPVRQAALSYWEDQPAEAGTLHVTGLPVAEETFGVEMFDQMMTSAPLAFVVIGILLFWFFRSYSLVFWTLLQAVFLAVWTLGGMIGLGYTVHIMSSMIPIFLLPIAVVDSIHVWSDYTEQRREGKSPYDAMAYSIEDLFFAVLFTSLTSMVGFVSLSMTGIPPVQVFGVAVGLGIFLDFVMEIIVLPAGIMLWEPSIDTSQSGGFIEDLVHFNNRISRKYSAWILGGGILLLGVGLFGMSLIVVNDNPTRWFHEDHPIRQADRYFNEAFAGSYPAYWVMETDQGGWYQPDRLDKLQQLTDRLESMEEVGKVTALPGLVNKIHREIRSGQVETAFPESPRAVRQYLFLYENSGNPQDLFRLVSPDAGEANVWFNLKSGDNRDMAAVMDRAEQMLSESDLDVETEWGGITVVNVIWQNVMVRGMGWALAGSFGVIFLMLLLLFRDPRWAILAIIPLAVTLVVVYGGIGWIGKDYDMPVAVLSSLSIGIGIDFAIHFIQRGREILQETGDWEAMEQKMGEEPSRAITRNVFVVALGFTPLLVAPLRPYVTVGVFMMVILSISGIATLTGLTASLDQFRAFFPGGEDDN